MTPPISTQRPMRRQDRALSLSEAIAVIEATDHAVISTVDASGTPYGVPVSPALVGNKLFFHGTREESRRADNIAQNPRVSVCFVSHARTLPEQYSVDYACAIVSGTCRRVLDAQEQAQAISALLARHAPGQSVEQNAQYMKRWLKHCAFWCVDIESITGKARKAS